MTKSLKFATAGILVAFVASFTAGGTTSWADQPTSPASPSEQVDEDPSDTPVVDRDVLFGEEAVEGRGEQEEDDQNDKSDDSNDGSGGNEQSDSPESSGNNTSDNSDGSSGEWAYQLGDQAVVGEDNGIENLCDVLDAEGNVIDTVPGCMRAVDQACGPDAQMISYETPQGGRFQCLNNADLDQLPETGNTDDAIAALARSEFFNMELDPAEVKFEPDLLGFGYKGRHTNMYADVNDQTFTTELLGADVDIHATPTQFHWDYGDDTSRTTYDPGEPLPDFDGTGEEIIKTDFATVTSHVYGETGIFPVTVETVYYGRYRISEGPWRTIAGSATVPSSPGEADIWTQNSRWVSGACESRDQWGCNGPIQFDPATDRPPKIYQDQYDENGNWLGPVH